jgi:hypothetical protein
MIYTIVREQKVANPFTIMRLVKGDASHQDVTYSNKEVQVNAQGQFFAAADLAHCEDDEKIPWDSPSLMPPLCSWSSFPLEPSPGLRQLVEFFTLSPHPLE